MKILFAFLLFPFLHCGSHLPDNELILQPGKQLNGGIPDSTHPTIVLELFTSQGCSSCPPADKLLGKYASNPAVVALSFHVDYWNYLGWKDPFSSSSNSDRQKMYSTLSNEGVYTPQLIINGQSQVIGSDEDAITRSIKQQTLLKAGTIQLNSAVSDGKNSRLKYSIHGLPAESELYCLLIQDNAVTQIHRGENSGISLTNYNVVRSLQSLNPAEGENEFTIALIPGIGKEHQSVVLLLQNRNSHKIIDVTRMAIQ